MPPYRLHNLISNIHHVCFEFQCAQKGCTAVEFDLALTKDEVPVIFHDSTVERLTGRPGVVSEMTWDELSKLDIAATHHLW